MSSGRNMNATSATKVAGARVKARKRCSEIGSRTCRCVSGDRPSNSGLSDDAGCALKLKPVTVVRSPWRANASAAQRTRAECCAE